MNRKIGIVTIGQSPRTDVVPEMAVPLETGNASVSVARFPGASPKRTIGMVWRRTNPLRTQFMELGALVREIWQRTCMPARVG